MPLFENFSYSASKAAVHMLTRHLAHTLVKDNITVNAIAPGLFPSKMSQFVFDGPGQEGAASNIRCFAPVARTTSPARPDPCRRRAARTSLGGHPGRRWCLDEVRGSGRSGPCFISSAPRREVARLDWVSFSSALRREVAASLPN